MDFFNEIDLYQFVNFVTRQDHILDLMLSNDKLLTSSLEDVSPLATSDQTTITFDSTARQSVNPTTHFRDYRRGNFELINNQFLHAGLELDISEMSFCKWMLELV